MNRTQILSENERRHIRPEYDPVRGIGAYGERRKVSVSDVGEHYLPVSFLEVPWVKRIVKLGSIEAYCEKYDMSDMYEGVCREWILERCRHDCEYCLATLFKIKIKNKPQDGNLIPSRTQRTVLHELLDMWYKGEPVRAIIVKCRQAFITTLMAAFFMWIQLYLFKSWNSLICGDVEGQATNAREMQTKMLKGIPSVLTENGVEYFTTPVDKGGKTRIINQRDCKISTGSMQKPENVRSGDNMLAFCTEVGLWKATLGKTPEDLIQAIRGGMDDVAYTVFCLESSPKGVGNYFYNQWIDAKKGINDLRPIFLPWYFVDRYSKKITNYDVFFDTWEKHDLKDYFDYLWSLGITLENLNWYMGKLKSMEHWRVQSEWPSDDVEAFQSTGSRVFPLLHVNKRRQECIEPTERCDIEADEAKGPDALKNIRLGSLSQNLSIWSRPDITVNIKYRYVVAVDIGKGKSTGSDYSVITVIDRYERMFGGADEIAAEWYGKIDIDLLAWKAAQISTFYNNALLVIEKNTIDTNTEYSKVLLSEIGKVYSNLYHTVSIDKIKGTKRITWGWHTNSSTKPVIVANMQAALRDNLYYERNKNACNEMDTYELKEDGTFGAADKCHDDLVMTRAIGLFVSSKMPVPDEVSEKIEVQVKKVVGYSSM